MEMESGWRIVEEQIEYGEVVEVKTLIGSTAARYLNPIGHRSLLWTTELEDGLLLYSGSISSGTYTT
jgi:hypothetical protein